MISVTKQHTSIRECNAESVEFYLAGLSLLVALWTFPAVWDLVVDNAFRLGHLRRDSWSAVLPSDASLPACGTNLEAAGVDDLIADGALHEREAELLLLRLHRVLLPRFTAGEAHGCVRQHRLRRATEAWMMH